MRTLATAASLACLILTSSLSRAEEVRFRISAGEHDRQDSIVSFALARDASVAWVARREDGTGGDQPVQITPDGKAFFVLPELARGASAEFVIERLAEPDPLVPWVEVLPEEGRLRISAAGSPALYYQAEERALSRPDLNPLIKRGGFLHPVISPSGKVVSQSYPLGHPHHQGIWAPWTRTRFENRTPDFWNMQSGTGKVEFEELEQTWSGPVVGGFRTRHNFVDLSAEEPKVALHETWSVNLFLVGAEEPRYRIFELSLEQECATDSPLELPQHMYGGLGFRGRDEWIGKENAFFLTSEGETDRVAGNGTRPRWTHVSGLLDGERTGIVIMGHPDNFRFPQPVRLHPNEPFFCAAPSQAGDWAITPEDPYRARFRFVVLDGEPDVELIERLWRDFAEPAEVVVAE